MSAKTSQLDQARSAVEIAETQSNAIRDRLTQACDLVDSLDTPVDLLQATDPIAAIDTESTRIAKLATARTLLAQLIPVSDARSRVLEEARKQVRDVEQTIAHRRREIVDQDQRIARWSAIAPVVAAALEHLEQLPRLDALPEMQAADALSDAKEKVRAVHQRILGWQQRREQLVADLRRLNGEGA